MKWACWLAIAYWVICFFGFRFTGVSPEAATKFWLALRDVDVIGGVLGNFMTHALFLGLLVVFATPLNQLLKQYACANPILVDFSVVFICLVCVFSGNQCYFDYSVHAGLFPDDVVLPLFLVTGVFLIAGWIDLAIMHPFVRMTCAVGATLIGIFVILPHKTSWEANAAQSAESQRPNLFIFGIDSLSLPVLQAHPDRLPNITRLWQSSYRYENAHTPLARTFPSWMSILSGKPPAEHGAVFSLRRVSKVVNQDLLSHRMREQGYRTIFALDERRFCHIDHQFGFDAVVGPELGILDFALQSLNDTPLTNMLLQWPISSRLLTYSRHNVASVANYDAHGFVGALLNELDKQSQPVMLAAHFESAHFPYQSRHAGISKEPRHDVFERHLASLEVVERQIAQLMTQLTQRGLLDNALLVLLSDHGESFGVPYPVRHLDGSLKDVLAYGHGA